MWLFRFIHFIEHILPILFAVINSLILLVVFWHWKAGQTKTKCERVQYLPVRWQSQQPLTMLWILISLCLYVAYTQQQQQQQPFYGPLSGTTRVSRYQKKHSPTHHPDHHPIFISFCHLPRSIASSLFKLCAWQSFCTTSFHVLFFHSDLWEHIVELENFTAASDEE